MHEVSLVEALLDQTDAAILPHPTAAVRQVTVRIGALAGVDHELFRTAFEGCKGARGYAGASLAVVHEAAGWACERCAELIAASDGPLLCPRCAGPLVLRTGGDLVLLRLDLEVPDV